MRDWLRRRWTCFRVGHDWTIDVPWPLGGVNVCMRCGKVVEF